MLIYKPSWLKHGGGRHDNLPIFSIDACPGRDRLATGGLNQKICIWDSKVIRKSAETPDNKTPNGLALLCTLSEHGGSIMCLRWSPNGVFLASGSDDTKIIIWELDKKVSQANAEIYSQYASSSEEGFDSVDIENYNKVAVLMQHSGDVVDLTWSPDGKFLASCGMDKQICIWNTDRWGREEVLNEHRTGVKGIDWDPRGKYLLSHSDDGKALLWNTATWKVEKEISSRPPNSVITSTFFQRSCWSADGSYVFLVNTTSSKLPVASLIGRFDLDRKMSLIGHTESIEVASFSPKAYTQSDGTEKIYFALGSQDCGVSLWQSASGSPVLMIKSLFTQSVMDIRWDDNGRAMFCCSNDGTVAIIYFDNMLGIPGEYPNTLNIEEIAITEAQRKQYLKGGPQKMVKKNPDMESKVEGNLLEKRLIGEKSEQGSFEDVPPKKKMAIGMSGELVAKDGFPAKPVARRIKPVIIAVAPQTCEISDPPKEIAKKRAELSKQSASIISEPKYPALNLGGPKEISTSFKTYISRKENLIVEIKNDEHEMRLMKDSTILWMHPIPKNVMMVAGTERWLAFACLQNKTSEIYVHLISGRQAFPPIVFGNAVSHLVVSSSDELLLAGMNNGMFYLWDIRKMQLVSEFSISAIVHNEKTFEISNIFISQQRCPIILTTEGDEFVYDLNMRVWMKYSIDRYLSSENIDFTENEKECADIENCIVYSRSSSYRPIEILSLISNSTKEARDITIIHAEYQLAVAFQFRMADAYVNWLGMYISACIKANEIRRIYELLSDIDGYSFKPPGEAFQSEEITPKGKNDTHNGAESADQIGRMGTLEKGGPDINCRGHGNRRPCEDGYKHCASCRCIYNNTGHTAPAYSIRYQLETLGINPSEISESLKYVLCNEGNCDGALLPLL